MGTMKRIAILAAVALLSACSGSGSGAKLAPMSPSGSSGAPAASSANRTAMVNISVVVPDVTGSNVSRATARKTQATTSPAIHGAIAIQHCNTTATAGGCSSRQIVTTTYDVSTCGGSSATPRTCNLSFPAVKDTSGSQFEVDLYDLAPVGSTSVPAAPNSPAGVGGVIAGGSCTRPATSTAIDASGTGPACLLAGGLSLTGQVIPTNGIAGSVTIHSIEDFIGKIEFGPGVPFPGTRADTSPGGLGAPTTTFIASKTGPTGATALNGSAGNGPIAGQAMSLGFDTSDTNIAPTQGTCVQSNADQYANSMSPIYYYGPPGTFDAPTTTAGTGTYAGPLLNNDGALAVDYTGDNADAASLLSFEAAPGVTAGTPTTLTTFGLTPCGQIATTFPDTPNGAQGAIGVNFPSDAANFVYNGTGAQNTSAHNEVGEAFAGNEFGGSTVVAPYWSEVTAQSQLFVGADFNGTHLLGAVSVNVVLDPLWGEVGNPVAGTSGFAPTFGSNSSATCAGALRPGPTPMGCTTASSLGAPLIVNLQGTGSTVKVWALQNWVPTNGSYSGSMAPGSGNCAGVVSFSGGTTGAVVPFSGSTTGLFPGATSGGASPIITGPGPTGGHGGGSTAIATGGPTANLNTTIGTGGCQINFTDGFSSFAVLFTNNPVPGTGGSAIGPV